MPLSSRVALSAFSEEKRHRRAVEDEALAEQQAQLVLGRHNRHPGARLLEGREDGGRAQPLRIVHHRLLAGGRIDEIVAADAVHGGRAPGDDREIVGIGEAGYGRMAAQVLALGDDALEVRHEAGRHGHLHVVGFAAVAADHDERRPRPVVVAAIHGNGLHRHASSGERSVTFISASTSRMALSTPAITRSSTLPMVPIRKLGRRVSLPG